MFDTCLTVDVASHFQRCVREDAISVISVILFLYYITSNKQRRESDRSNANSVSLNASEMKRKERKGYIEGFDRSNIIHFFTVSRPDTLNDICMSFTRKRDVIYPN